MSKRIERLSASVAAGAPVDWVLEKTRRPDHHEEIEQLAIVERIRDAHRSAVIDLSGSEEETANREAGTDPAPIFAWGSLDVLEKIGEGPGGEVYRAVDRALRAEVALKLLRTDRHDSDALADRFLEEGRRLARVHHENVLLVHGAGRHGERAGIWTELVRGESLEQNLIQNGPLSAGEAAVIGLDLCRALAAVHAAGIVHRDVKASNIMRGNRGRIVLMDFGASAERFGDPSADASTQGTPIYMAPEQFRGQPGGIPADIYALGVLLYHLVTSAYPIEATSYDELVDKHAKGDRIPLRDRRPDLPLVFVRAVERALDPDPALRYQSAGEMERGISATIRAFGEAADNKRRLHGFLLGAVFTAVIVGALWADLRKPPPPPPTPRSLAAAIQLLAILPSGDTAPLGPDGRVAPGSQLSMLLRANDSLHVYVLDYDDRGEFYILYPAKGLVPGNPISGNQTHRLPGDVEGKVVYWTVTSAGGRERLIVIGSRQALPDFEAQVAKMPTVSLNRIDFAALDPMQLRDARGLRGIHSGTAQAPPSTEAKRRVLDYVDGLELTGKQDGSIFVWRQELSNPSRRDSLKSRAPASPR